MEYRPLGHTGLKVSALGFGCGAVGGLLVRGDPDDMVQGVARAIESGITYFDTARAYGNGQSEASLGRVLEELRADVVVGTKVNLLAEEMADIEQSIIDSVEGSLRRLRRDRIDLIQLHNAVRHERQAARGWVSLADVEAALAAFEKLRHQGKVSHYGINGLGDTDVLHQAIDLGRAETVQSCFNLINPTAGRPTPTAFPFQDYRQLIDGAAAHSHGCHCHPRSGRRGAQRISRPSPQRCSQRRADRHGDKLSRGCRVGQAFQLSGRGWVCR